MRFSFVRSFALFAAGSCALNAEPAGQVDPSLEAFVQNFKGKGALNDGSKALTPEETIAHFKLAPGLKMEVVAAEPVITQPLNLHFDERGRLWVVQYLQYPFPAGLKILKYDEYLRAVFDKVPPPPPQHFPGKDRITILEDKNGDGTFESAKDFVSDLNIARSVVTGRGGVWILNPPYLLFYPDANRDDVPDGDPKVVLSGFGLEDTHSGANSLAWGPDGWLYGAHGSTCTAEVKGVKFAGQAIWRFDPATEDFEVFAEGGGNTYSLEFDAKGRAFSGTNFGDTRGMYYPQGSAGVKNWGKHGPLMNPYSFGWFEHMAHTGYQPRFAQTIVIYEGGAIPQLEGALVAPMSLMNRVMASKLSHDTSTYRTDDLDPLVLTDDRWFRPVDTKVGPDGAIYLADWYDSRLTHVDPRDTWDKEHGRIYRLKADTVAPGSTPVPGVGAGVPPARTSRDVTSAEGSALGEVRFGGTPKPTPGTGVLPGTAASPLDLAALSGEQLIETLRNPNKWFRQMALRIFYDRKDAALVPRLRKLVTAETGQFALECLWALHASGGFTEEVALATLEHADEHLRTWTVRLLGDRYPPARYGSAARTPAPLNAALQARLETLARTEPAVQTRAQLASAAKRLPGTNALPILRELLFRAEDAGDKHVPLLLWWALESKAVSDRPAVLALLRHSTFWRTPLVEKTIVARLGQRYTAERSEQNLDTAAQLLALAPGPDAVGSLVRGMEAGLQGDRVTAVPAALRAQVAEVWKTQPHTPVLISFALRLGHEPAAEAAVQTLADPKTKTAERKSLLELLAERRVTAAVPVIVALLNKEKADGAKVDLLNALAQFHQPEVATALMAVLPGASTKVRATIITALSSRADWARSLLELVDRSEVKKEHVAVTSLLAIQKLGDPPSDALIKKHWGSLRASPQEKEELIKNLRVTIAKSGDAVRGRELFKTSCAACHMLKGEGAKIGPDLTGYERDNLDFMLPAIVDPSLGIREEYTLYILTRKDGQLLAGFVTETTPQFVTLQDVAGGLTKVAREDLQSLIASPVSLMPEGLLNALSPEQTRDLFTYLMAK